MNRLKNYIMPALYNIRHNLSFSLFYVLGTAMSFVFIAIALQVLYSFIGNVPPVDKGDRIVSFGSFEDKGGRSHGINAFYTETLIKNIKGCEMYARWHIEDCDIFVDNGMVSQCVNYVNADYWKVFRFKFIEGRAFSQQEYENKQPVAVINQMMAKALFRGENAVGRKIEIQKVSYTITGVVENISFFTTLIADGFWLSDQFNTFTPSGSSYYHLEVLFPSAFPIAEAKREVAQAVKAYFDARRIKVDISAEKMKTRKEVVMQEVGLDILSYGIPVIVLLLLVVPAINIVTLSISNSNRRSEEIAIRRAIGASRPVLFSYIVVENVILVLAGIVVGLLLFSPVVYGIEYLCFEDSLLGNVSFLTQLNFMVILCGVLPLSILFTLLVSMFPAFVTLRKNMAEVLKGGSK